MIDSRAGTEPMHLVLNEEDLPYEEEILRNPHSIKPWIRYIGQITPTTFPLLNVSYFRAQSRCS